MRTALSRFIPVAVVATVIGWAGATASATVQLSITDGDSTPTAGSAPRGGTFSFTLNLISTAEQTTGLDYFLRDNTFVSGTPRFRISDRNITGSTYSDPFFADAAVEAQPSSLLNPSNDNDLGATLGQPEQPEWCGNVPGGELRDRRRSEHAARHIHPLDVQPTRHRLPSWPPLFTDTRSPHTQRTR
jgi:hypothetical protein